MNADTHTLLRAELMGDEALKLRVYDDRTGKAIGPGSVVEGNPTIAVGRNLSGNGVSKAEAEYLLENDLQSTEGELLSALPWVAKLTPARQCVMFCLHFNISLHNVAHFIHGWPRFIGQMQAGDYENAADNLETTQPWASEVGPRAIRLAKMVRLG